MNEEERIKKEKDGLQVINDIPRYAQEGFQIITKDDIKRLKWYGLYHDDKKRNPNAGYFMMRIKIPGGILNTQKLRTIAEVSKKFGKNFDGEITTRQDIQLHYMQIQYIPQIFEMFKLIGLTTTGACGDGARNVTTCPVSGFNEDELFDTEDTMRKITRIFLGNPKYSNLPRKYKICVTSCKGRCIRPEVNCVGFLGVNRQSNGSEELGFSLWVGGSLGVPPMLSKPANVFVKMDEVEEVARAITEIWRDAPKYRESRTRSRLKWMVKDMGMPKFREAIETKLGRKLEDYNDVNDAPKVLNDHTGIHKQKQEEFYFMGVPVPSGRLSPDKLFAIADLVDKYGSGELRLTVQQNFIIPNVRKENIDSASERLSSLSLPVTASPFKSNFIACTGLPFCNFAVTETKFSMKKLTDYLESKFKDRIEELKDVRIHASGCPHSCAQHWIADIGLQGSSTKVDGKMEEAFDLMIGGSTGKYSTVAERVRPRIPSRYINYVIESLLRTYLDGHSDGETFKEFSMRYGLQQIGIVIDNTLARFSKQG
ncbi:MAG: nitrite/sulfite reductase [Nitrososphaerales archaeon]